MKIVTVYILLMIFASVACADDISTLDGKTYRDIKVVSSDPISITIVHSNGVGRILFQELSEKTQQKYGYNSAKAAAYLDQLKAKRAAEAGKQSADYATPFEEETNRPSQQETTKPTTQSVPRDSSDHSAENWSGNTTASGQKIYVGPRGGHYHYSASGNKVYEKKKK